MFTTETCYLPKDTGPCVADYLHYYWDLTIAECRPFVYGGCQGNENNFPSQEDCYSVCGGGEGKRFYNPGHCYEPVSAGSCDGTAAVRWYFDAEAGDCFEFDYSGCDGNGNNFHSHEDCLVLCSTG